MSRIPPFPRVRQRMNPPSRHDPNSTRPSLSRNTLPVHIRTVTSVVIVFLAVLYPYICQASGFQRTVRSVVEELQRIPYVTPPLPASDLRDPVLFYLESKIFDIL
jgi:hypothetical protein